MDVYWFEQRLSDVPEYDDWLGSQELQHLAQLRFPKRRAEWRLGRWTAKCAVALHRQYSICPDNLAGIEISTSASGAPIILETHVLETHVSTPLTVSISHSSGLGVSAVIDGVARMGCDVEKIEPHSDAFVRDYFTLEEQVFVADTPCADRPCVTSLLWSAKESALKALHEGLRLDTRSVAVTFGPRRAAEWSDFQVISSTGIVFYGWWLQSDGFVKTIAADSLITQPISLQAHHAFVTVA